MRTRWRGGEPGERAGRKGRGGDKDENSQLFCVLHKEQVYGSLIRTCLKESQLKLPRHLAIIYLVAPRRPLKPGPCMVTSRPCVRGSPAQGPPIRPTADSGCQVLAGCDVDTRDAGSASKPPPIPAIRRRHALLLRNTSYRDRSLTRRIRAWLRNLAGASQHQHTTHPQFGLHRTLEIVNRSRLASLKDTEDAWPDVRTREADVRAMKTSDTSIEQGLQGFESWLYCFANPDDIWTLRCSATPAQVRGLSERTSELQHHLNCLFGK